MIGNHEAGRPAPSRRRLGWIVAGVGTVGACVSVAAVAVADTGATSRAPEPVLMTGASASPAVPGIVRSTPTEQRAMRWLVSAARAERSRTYSGTQYVSAWHGGTAASYVVELQHVPGEGTLVRVQPSSGGASDVVLEVDRSEEGLDPLDVPALDTGPVDLLGTNYDLSVRSESAHRVQVVASRADGSVAARFWIDRTSGLLVRREVFDSAGRLVRANAFVDLDLHDVATPKAMPSPEPDASGERLSSQALDALRSEGWRLPERLPGGMVLYDARRTADRSSPVMHLSYSDGLSTMSVFVERGRLDTGRLSSWHRGDMSGPVYLRDDGLAERLVWDGDGSVYTVVADAPSDVVEDAVTGLPHGTVHRGVVSRVRHGLSRLGRWLDPFG